MNRPKRGRAPIKKSNNKKSNTLKHERGSKKGKKIKQKNRAQKELRFRDTDSLKLFKHKPNEKNDLIYKLMTHIYICKHITSKYLELKFI